MKKYSEKEISMINRSPVKREGELKYILDDLQNTFPWAKCHKELVFCYNYDVIEQPKCLNCKAILQFKGNGKGYQKYCSKKCVSVASNKNRDQKAISEKRKLTCIEKYGVDNFWKSKEFFELKEKSDWEETRIKAVKKSLTAKFGGPSPFFSEEIKNKKNETMLNKYGTASYFGTEEFKNRETKILQGQKAHRAAIESLRDKYNDPSITSPWSLKYVQEKMQQTRIEKYGTAWPMQNYVSFMKNKASCYSLKEVIDKNGKVHLLQGYEPQVFEVLSKQGKNLSSDCDLLPIFYLENGSRYYPDFFDLDEKVVYEIKSSYTYSVAIEKLKMCRKSVESKGFIYKILIWENGSIEEK